MSSIHFVRFVVKAVISFSFFVGPIVRANDAFKAQVEGRSKTPQSAIDNDGLAQIPGEMRRFVDDGQIAGAVTLLVHQGLIVHHEAVGYADWDNRVPMRKDSLFAIASMTKPISATAIMILRDEGKLSIDDAVSKYIPQFKEVALASGPPNRAITIRDVLTHTSGLGGSQETKGSLKSTVELLAKRKLSFEPGTKWQYSPGLAVCGRIVEVVSGKSFDQFLTDRIFRPLRMVDTTFRPTTAQRFRLANLYKPGTTPKTIERTEHWISDLSPDRVPNPSAGLFSTAADLARFYQMMLNGGTLNGRRIVSEAAVKEMGRVQTGDLVTGFTPGNGWGLGFCVVRKPQGVTSMLSPGTFGHGGAFGTQGWIDPVRETIFVLMIQRTGFGSGDASDIRRTFQQLATGALGAERAGN